MSVNMDAMNHPDRLGAGAKKRAHLKPADKFDTVMAEFHRGTLFSGGGQKVTDPRQAEAIAYSEMNKHMKKMK